MLAARTAIAEILKSKRILSAKTISDEILKSKQLWRTAIKRNGPSAPMKYIWDNYTIPAESRALDFGCGRGEDVEFLSARNIIVHGYDPFHYFFNYRPDGIEFNYVFITYVLNIIEDPFVRKNIICDAAIHLNGNGTMFISVRTDLKLETATQFIITLDMIEEYLQANNMYCANSFKNKGFLLVEAKKI